MVILFDTLLWRWLVRSTGSLKRNWQGFLSFSAVLPCVKPEAGFSFEIAPHTQLHESTKVFSLSPTYYNSLSTHYTHTSSVSVGLLPYTLYSHDLVHCTKSKSSTLGLKALFLVLLKKWYIDTQNPENWEREKVKHAGYMYVSYTQNNMTMESLNLTENLPVLFNWSYTTTPTSTLFIHTKKM